MILCVKKRGDKVSKEVSWNRFIFDEFCRDAMLSDDEIKILETRIRGWSRTKQSIEFGLSLSVVDKIIATLKQKYDNVQPNNPILPPRRK